jgi:hypothetical protein
MKGDARATMSSSPVQAGATRQCVHCGKPVRTDLRQCPFCREVIPEVPRTHRHGSDGRREIRRGLLYMLLAAGIYYLAGGYSAIKLPVTIVPAVTTYLAPLLFFGGLGLSLYGAVLRFRS